MQLSDAQLLFLLLCGPVAGSFLGLVADRLPRGESIVAPRSRCRRCGARLGPGDLVPLFSFLLARGRCRHCGAPVPVWLFGIELASAGAALAAGWLAPSLAAAWAGAAFLWLLLALIAGDLLHFRLPDPLTGALLLAALALSALGWGPPPAQALWGAALGAGSFLALRLGYRRLRGREGLGLGDVKLMAGLGAALGPWDLPVMVLLAALSALTVAAVQALGRGGGALRPARALPFGAALAAATAFLWLAQRLPV